MPSESNHAPVDAAGLSPKVASLLEDLREAGADGRILGIEWSRPMIGDHAGEVDGEPLRPGPRLQVCIVIAVKGCRSVFVRGDVAVYQSERAKTYQCPTCAGPVFTDYEGDALPSIVCDRPRGHLVEWNEVES